MPYSELDVGYLSLLACMNSKIMKGVPGTSLLTSMLNTEKSCAANSEH